MLAIYMLNGGSYLPALAIFGVAAAFAVYKVAAYTRIDRQWLIVPLVMLTIFINSFFLEGAPRAAVHYGLVVLFCAPCVPFVWRSGICRRGGFELYSIYFVWALVTVTYSLAPEFSLVRLADAMLMFCAVSAIVYGVEEPDDLTRLVERFLIGCGVFVVILAFAAVALPRSMTWNVPEQYTVNQEVERFRGLLNNPNDVGVLMLATVGPALAFWNRFEPRKKKWLAAIALLSVSEAALADSRTPFIALAAGVVCDVLWRYRLRGILLLAGAGVLAIAALPIFGHSIGEYTGRGDVTTLTGRTDMWAYVVHEIGSRADRLWLRGRRRDFPEQIFSHLVWSMGPGLAKFVAQRISQPRDWRRHPRDAVLALHRSAPVVVCDAAEGGPVEPQAAGAAGRCSLPDT